MVPSCEAGARLLSRNPGGSVIGVRALRGSLCAAPVLIRGGSVAAGAIVLRPPPRRTDRKSVVSGKSVAVRLALGGLWTIKKKKQDSHQRKTQNNSQKLITH